MLERLMGDVELAGTILRRFLADMPRQIEALRALADELEQAGKAGEHENFACLVCFVVGVAFTRERRNPMPLTQSRS